MDGGRLAGRTATVKLCVAKLPLGSVARTVTSARPSCAADGVQVTRPVAEAMAMPAGATSSDQVRVSLSGSVASASYWYVSPTVALCGGVETICGGRLLPAAAALTV